MKTTINTEDIKNISYSGLLELKKFFDNNKIRYYLAYGTLIGAIRHNGFIPWDDDIDIWVPREDYEKLKIIIENYKNEEWEFYSYTNNNNYYFPWIKYCNKKTTIEPSRFKSGLIYGVAIDILPLDYAIGNSIEEAKKDLIQSNQKYKKRYKLLKPFNYGDSNKIKNIYFKIASLLLGNNQKFLNNLEKKELSKDKDTCKYVKCFLTPAPFVVEKDLFSESIYWKFEDADFSIPNGYDVILRTIYGDYMKMPPKEKRVTHHNYTAYRIKERDLS